MIDINIAYTLGLISLHNSLASAKQTLAMAVALRVTKIADDITYDLTRSIQAKRTRITNVEFYYALTLFFQFVSIV
jgi:hypothetical protein